MSQSYKSVISASRKRSVARRSILKVEEIADREDYEQYVDRERKKFEVLLKSRPRAFNKWFEYINFEIKLENYAQVRKLFKKVLNVDHGHINSWKKYLKFEKEHFNGDKYLETLKEAGRLLPLHKPFRFELIKHYEKTVTPNSLLNEAVMSVLRDWLSFKPGASTCIAIVRFFSKKMEWFSGMETVLDATLRQHQTVSFVNEILELFKDDFRHQRMVFDISRMVFTPENETYAFVRLQCMFLSNYMDTNSAVSYLNSISNLSPSLYSSLNCELHLMDGNVAEAEKELHSKPIGLTSFDILQISEDLCKIKNLSDLIISLQTVLQHEDFSYIVAQVILLRVVSLMSSSNEFSEVEKVCEVIHRMTFAFDVLEYVVVTLLRCKVDDERMSQIYERHSQDHPSLSLVFGECYLRLHKDDIALRYLAEHCVCMTTKTEFKDFLSALHFLTNAQLLSLLLGVSNHFCRSTDDREQVLAWIDAVVEHCIDIDSIVTLDVFFDPFVSLLEGQLILPIVSRVAEAYVELLNQPEVGLNILNQFYEQSKALNLRKERYILLHWIIELSELHYIDQIDALRERIPSDLYDIWPEDRISTEATLDLLDML
ncbi:hypothetical protein PCE1_000638 [Barthelona sp. PCE]